MASTCLRPMRCRRGVVVMLMTYMLMLRSRVHRHQVHTAHGALPGPILPHLWMHGTGVARWLHWLTVLVLVLHGAPCGGASAIAWIDSFLVSTLTT